MPSPASPSETKTSDHISEHRPARAMAVAPTKGAGSQTADPLVVSPAPTISPSDPRIEKFTRDIGRGYGA